MSNRFTHTVSCGYGVAKIQLRVIATDMLVSGKTEKAFRWEASIEGTDGRCEGEDDDHCVWVAKKVRYTSRSGTEPSAAQARVEAERAGKELVSEYAKECDFVKNAIDEANAAFSDPSS